MDKGLRGTIAITTVNADLITPVDILYHCKPAALLESAAMGGRSGRYTICVIDTAFTYFKRDARYFIQSPDGSLQATQDTSVFSGLSALARRYDFSAAEFGFPLPTGGVGFAGFECAAEHEPAANVCDLPAGEYGAYFLFGRSFVVFDHLHHECHCAVVRYGDDDRADINRLCNDLAARIERLSHEHAPPEQPFHAAVTAESVEDKQRFLSNVRYIKGEIEHGNLLQCVLSRRKTIITDMPAEVAYRKLRKSNPSPYMFFVRAGDDVVFGASPEEMVTVRHGRITMKPIAGTRPRGMTRDEDDRLERELLADEKECAEHRMLVDLTRSDIGRVAEPGTVRVSRMMYAERYSHVMHIVSDVEGVQRHDTGIDECIQSVFPAGTVSGAPKIRAITTLAKCEAQARGVYAGLVGYFDQHGNFDSCIAIRTAVQRGTVVTLQAGAGIVFDSDPEREYQETEHKMNALCALYESGDSGGKEHL